ncbi:uncharacterized protein [Ptychodera flava]|uniref:uncharacterized protein n=1 Tax=Ptychodera flava TaxID=63121 RepID=UPI003969DEA8
MPPTPASCKDSTDGDDKSTNKPMKTKMKSSKRHQAEMEYELIKGVAESITERNKRQKCGDEKKDAVETFGNYVTQTLRELEPKMRHLAQHRISNILFEAQTGSLMHYNAFQNHQQFQAYTQNWQVPYQQNSSPINTTFHAATDSAVHLLHSRISGNQITVTQSIHNYLMNDIHQYSLRCK